MAKNYKGNCFEAAHDALQDLHDQGEKPFIVNGFVRRFADLDSLWIVHAWVECGGMVYDYTSSKKPMLKDIYYLKNNVPDLKFRYDFHSYHKRARKIGRFCPLDPVMDSMIDHTISDPKAEYEWHSKILNDEL